MNYLNKQELLNVRGGFKLTSSFLNSIVRAANLILELGRSAGSAIRRVQTGKIC